MELSLFKPYGFVFGGKKYGYLQQVSNIIGVVRITTATTILNIYFWRKVKVVHQSFVLSV